MKHKQEFNEYRWIFGNLIEVKLLTSPKHLDALHKFSTIKNVVNKEDQLEVEVSIRNYYLNNLVEKEVVKILSWVKQ